MARGLDLFKNEVRPVFVQLCLKCHGGKTTEGELDISDRDRLLKGGNGGPAIVAGESRKSLLFRMINHDKMPFMPFESSKLAKEKIEQIAAWIDHGAPYDAPLLKQEDARAWTNRSIAPEAKQHWAYQPLRHNVPPANVPGAKTPIDRFILARLEEKKLQPNDRATMRQLVRRAYFDLIGLPPSPHEVDEFLRDADASFDAAWGRVIDKLLASPHYGERWGRHWLDLVRFAESHGFEHDYDRPSAYHYRDFVIQALNQDLPYNTFVKWQLAGDEIAPRENLALMATGFLAAGVHSTQITKNEVEKQRYDELDDILATTGTSMLGLTIGCARCHDHKFDAIPSADYYRMLATFTTVVRSEIDINLDPDNYRVAKEAFDREHAPFEASLKKFEEQELPARLGQWLRVRAEQPLPRSWSIPAIASIKSTGGATLTKLEDGSILVSGANPPTETLTVMLTTEQSKLTGIRLEALTHSSLVRGGPGRAANGNFALTDFKVSAAPKSGGKGVEVQLKDPRSTFDQKGLGIAGAIDTDKTTGWAIDPQIGRDHAAAFVFATPIGFERGTTLTVTLKFQNNVGHGIGRPRFSLTSSSEPLDLQAPALPEAIDQLLRLPAAGLSAEQTQQLLRWYRYLDPEWTKINTEVQKHATHAPKPNMAKALICSEGLPPLRLHTQGDDFFRDTYFLKRGDPSQKDGIAPAGYLQLLCGATNTNKWATQAPSGATLSYRRSAFADWITDVDDGAGRLLARVIVNRLWQHHMGRGIVATPSDFGLRGEKPTHPELLDFLASELIRNGWRLKPIHQLMMRSAVYQQSSQFDEVKARIDKDNVLWWRWPTRRLEGEVIRDALLHVSGALEPKMFGPGTLDEASRRRSVYFTMKRSKLIPSLIIFDAPDGTTGVGERPSTTIAPQALHLMNNKQVRVYAHGLAKRVTPAGPSDLAKSIKEIYEIALAREPNGDEIADGLEFIKQQTASYRDREDAPHLALTDFCQVVMSLNEFVYVE